MGRAEGGFEGCYERAGAFWQCKFHHKMSIVMIEQVFAAEKITFLKRSERLNMLFGWQSPPGSITDCWQSLSVLNCYEPVCECVCVRDQTPGTPPVTTTDNADINTKNDVLQITACAQDILVCVSHMSFLVLWLCRNALLCVFLLPPGLAAVVPRHQPFVLPQTRWLGRPGLRYLH